jgi:hypothetical protein
MLARSQYASGRSCDRPTIRFSIVFLRPQSKSWVGTQIPRYTACLSCSPPNININISPSVASPILKSKFRHVMPSQGLMSELAVVIECSRNLLNFSPCSVFRLYLRHNWMAYLLPTPPLPERRAGTAWGPLCFPLLNIVSRTSHPHSPVSLLRLHRVKSYYNDIIFAVRSVLFFFFTQRVTEMRRWLVQSKTIKRFV